MSEVNEWVPPFCANEIAELECPKCESGGRVCVRDRAVHMDGDEVEGYCAKCHARLLVTANVEITFSDVEEGEL